MQGKTEDLPSSSEAGVFDVEELRDFDSQHVTLAQAIEQAQIAVETSTKIKGEMVEELERFRAAMRRELKERRIKPDLLHDLFAFLGLCLVAGGIAVAFHWAYSLIVVGAIVLSLSLIPLFRPSVKI